MRRLVCLVVIVVSAALVSAQARDTLDIYVIDVEGGASTLFVSPSGESLLVDTGNGGANAQRDVGRILEAATDAGLTQIDHVILTHWHGDHIGGITELASRIPIRHFIDHGPTNAQPNETTDTFLATTYPGLYASAKHTVVKPGDTIPVTGLNVQVVSSAGDVLGTPLAGAGSQNPLCGNPEPADGFPEDMQSVGAYISYGRFSTLQLGDLTRDKEYAMVCPRNLIGTIDVLLGLHHGQDTSSAIPFVHAIQPRAAIMNNGTRKGGYPDVMTSLYSSSGFEDLWQMHFSLLSGQEYAAPGLFIANGVDQQPSALPVAPMAAPARGSNAPPPPIHSGRAYWVKVSAQEDGTFTITNARNGFSKVYRREVQGTR
ncbi:MAG: MBL fold metallo-hydrolase [Chloroflexi bacterium]|nr:MBL fold metallo-hydrolase [Chloroflexota bacterium]